MFVRRLSSLYSLLALRSPTTGSSLEKPSHSNRAKQEAAGLRNDPEVKIIQAKIVSGNGRLKRAKRDAVNLLSCRKPNELILISGELCEASDNCAQHDTLPIIGH